MQCLLYFSGPSHAMPEPTGLLCSAVLGEESLCCVEEPTHWDPGRRCCHWALQRGTRETHSHSHSHNPLTATWLACAVSTRRASGVAPEHMYQRERGFGGASAGLQQGLEDVWRPEVRGRAASSAQWSRTCEASSAHWSNSARRVLLRASSLKEELPLAEHTSKGAHATEECRAGSREGKTWRAAGARDKGPRHSRSGQVG